jgi:hypothetical protein
VVFLFVNNTTTLLLLLLLLQEKKYEANQKTILLWMALVTKKAKKPAAQCGNLGEKNEHFNKKTTILLSAVYPTITTTIKLLLLYY